MRYSKFHEIIANFKHGDNVVVLLESDNKLYDGIISFSGKHLYICSNCPHLNGNIADEMFGFPYSWIVRTVYDLRKIKWIELHNKTDCYDVY